MVKSFDGLKGDALIIKNEIEQDKNSATRIGTMFSDVVDKMEEESETQELNLQQAIEAEAQARMSADINLYDAINAEAQARQTDVNNLDGRLKQEANVRNNAVKAVQENLDAEIAMREVAYLGDLGSFVGVEAVGFVDSLVASIGKLGKGMGRYSFNIGGGGAGSKQFVTLAKVGSLTKLTIEGCLKAEVLNGDGAIDSVTSTVSTVVECDVTKKVWSYVGAVVDDTYLPEMLDEATVDEEAVQRSNKVMSKEQTLGVIGKVKKEVGSYFENFEYIRAYTDKDGLFIWGIKRDGSVEFAKGVPTPVKNYIVDYVINRLDNVIMPEIEKLNQAHEQYLVESENNEWLRAVVDSEGCILWGIRRDGSVDFYKGVPSSIKAYIESLDRNNDEEIERINQLVIGLLADVKTLTDTYHYVTNMEWAYAVLDEDNRLLLGIQHDGNVVIPNKEMCHVESNMEYMKAVVDANGNILFGIKTDGSCYIPKGISEEARNAIEELRNNISFFDSADSLEWIEVTTDSNGSLLEGRRKDGTVFYPKQEMLNKIEDKEGRSEVTLDSDGRVIAYRDANGVRHENKQHINEATFGKMVLSYGNGKEIAEVLDMAGFKSDFPVDFSKNDFVELPIPRVAAVVKLHVPKIPTTKTDDIKGMLEYTDKDGNYFSKPIVLNAQGSSSMGYYVKNMAVDFDDDSKIKFGHWVSQDSFHIKKYYIDVFRGQCVVGYHLMEQVYQTRPLGEKYPYDLINQNAKTNEGLGKFKRDFNTGAMCHPDGFPIIVYHVVDGVETYMGVYAWCLKKHRDNYYADKSKATNIILDGTLYDQYIWNGEIDWTKFEIRNPKDLIDINGNDYDGENPLELSDTDELSSATKSYIIRLSQAKNELKSNMTKDVFEKYFLVDAFIDWFVVSQVLYNIDGFGKNWIWCTWDGEHWTPTLYDVDSIFGSSPIGTFIEPASLDRILEGSIAYYLSKIYTEEIKARYKELRDKGIFTVENIIGLLTGWIERIGYDNLKDDIDLYDQTPSYRESHLNENWDILNYTWNLENDSYDNNKVYSVGESCVYYGYTFKAKKEVKGLAPLEKVYNKTPYGMGMYNSPLRVNNWLKERLSFLDNIYNK